MSSQRFEGGNLDEALGDAARTLGVEKYQLRYHVVLEKRGFLGAVKRVVIEAEPDHGAPEPPEEPRTRSAPERATSGRGRPSRPQNRRQHMFSAHMESANVVEAAIVGFAYDGIHRHHVFIARPRQRPTNHRLHRRSHRKRIGQYDRRLNRS